MPDDFLDKYIREVRAEQMGVGSPRPGEIPTFAQASAYFGWGQPQQGGDAVTQLLQGIMGSGINNPYGAVSDDMRQWYTAATDYAEKLGYWPEWEILAGIGVPIGQPYQPADLSPVIGQTSEYTAGIFGGEPGRPVTQQEFDIIQGSQQFQEFDDEARRYQNILKIMEATGYDTQTASFIYHQMLDDAGFEGGSKWAKQSRTIDEWKKYLEKQEGYEDVDEDALKEFYRTVPNYTQLRTFDEWLGGTSHLADGVLAEGLERAVKQRESMGYERGKNKADDRHINLTYLHDVRFPQAVEMVNQIASQLRQQGDIATLIRFVRDSGIDSNESFSVEESLKALKWLADNGFNEAKDLWNEIENDPKVFELPSFRLPTGLTQWQQPNYSQFI